MNKTTKNKISQLQKLLVLNRMKILEILYKKPTCVCQMVKRLDIKNNLISHHLKTLLDMGFLENRKNGRHVIYNLQKSKRNDITKLFTLLKK